MVVATGIGDITISTVKIAMRLVNSAVPTIPYVWSHVNREF